jgi:nitroimidazol reductase NimA-like FMN-containing flavoprotein (pyridoxamine 5'-phosphate oxidase superfamily)
MFQEMRRQDRQLTRPEAEEILAQGLYGVLSINAGDYYAYGVPFSYVYRDNRIYLHCALEGKKLTLMRRNNKVSFCVVSGAEPLPHKYSMKYRSAMAFGEAVEVKDNQEKLAALIALVEKYYSDQDHIEKGKVKAAESLDKTLILRIDLDHITGKVRK